MIENWTQEVYDSLYLFSGERYGRWPGTRPRIDLMYHWMGVGYSERNLARDKLAKVLDLRPGDQILSIGTGFGWSLEGWEELGVHCIGTDTSPYITEKMEVSEEAELRVRIAAAGHDDADDYYVLGPGPDVKEMPLPWVLRVHPGSYKNRLIWQIRPLDLYLRERWGGPLRTKSTVLAEPCDTGSSRKAVGNQCKEKVRYVITEHCLNGYDDEGAANFMASVEKTRERHKGSVVVHFVTERCGVQDPRLNWKPRKGWLKMAKSLGLAHHRFLFSLGYELV